MARKFLYGKIYDYFFLIVYRSDGVAKRGPPTGSNSMPASVMTSKGIKEIVDKIAHHQNSAGVQQSVIDHWHTKPDSESKTKFTDAAKKIQAEHIAKAEEHKKIL